jgi:lysophospholipase L1-like esterase
MSHCRSLQVALGSVAFMGALTLLAPSAEAQCRIEPLGDSITAGVGSSPHFPGYARGAGYRAHIVALSPVNGIQLVGARSGAVPEWISTGYGWIYDGGAGPVAQPNHSGVPGYRTDELKTAVSQGYPVFPGGSAPNIVLVHAGTNDFIQQVPAATAATNLKSLLTALASKYPSPTTKIIVAQIIPFGPNVAAGMGRPWLNPATMNAEVYAYNTFGIPAAVNALNAAHPQKFSIVDMNTGFWTATLPDGVHPNDYGYAELAQRWRVAIKNVAWSAGCVPTP